MHKFFHKIRIGISGLSVCILLLGGCSGNSGTGQISPTISAPVDFPSFVEETFRGWKILWDKTIHYEYEVPRGDRTAMISAEVVTFTGRRPV